ncbi:hypothetical protein ACFYWY_26420 [Streptomyces sp. NPDC002870]|uniref:hypothetical protein n=1 Tax=Streptomyces sp. NPDC002870 TaxID=3364666 RepID=UPI0036A3B9D1
MTRSTYEQVERPSLKGGARPAPTTSSQRPRKPAFTARRGLVIAAYMAPAVLFVAVFI